MISLILHERTEKLVEQLTGNLPQALVVDGASGSGVLTVAKTLAAGMGSLPLIIEPKRSVKGELVVDKVEGNIVIDDIRRLYEQTRTRQPEAQVYILDTGERSMTTAAQNAFLKLLEEPRPGLHFIIATHHYDQLLPTIVSRSQRLTLLAISDQQTRNLIEALGVSDETKKARLSFVGQGLPALITRLANDDKAYDARVMIMSDAKTLIGGSMDEKLAVIQKYRDNRAGAIMLIDDMNHQLQVIMRARPSVAIASAIDKHLEARERIMANGNIRLQLVNDAL